MDSRRQYHVNLYRMNLETVEYRRGPTERKIREHLMKIGSRVLALLTAIIGFNNANVNPSRSLAIWDEAIYYNVAQNVLEGYWLLPHFTDSSHPIGPIVPFLHKPPLVYWLHATGMVLLGEGPASARLISALATAALLGITVLLATHLGNVLVGAGTSILILSMPSLFGTHAGNNIATDPFLLLFFLVAIYLFVLAADADTPRVEQAAAVGAGVAGGLAVLSKGTAAGPLALAAVPLAVLLRRDLGWWSWSMLIGVGILLPALWFVPVAAIAPNELWTQMVTRQTVGRATGELFVQSEGTFGFMRFGYLREAPTMFGNAWWLLPIAGAAIPLLNYLNRMHLRLHVFAWSVVFVVGGIYMIFGNHPWYWMPLGPAIALLVGDLIAIGTRSLVDLTATATAIRSFQQK